MKKKVLFVCTHNSLRSQMAEGLLNYLGAGQWKAYSAGTVATEVNSTAIEVLKEKGIDISGHYSKTLDEFNDEKPDFVITVCDNAKGSCPVFPGNCKHLHWPIEDPGTFGLKGEERLNAFRKTRDILFGRIQEFIMENE